MTAGPNPFENAAHPPDRAPRGLSYCAAQVRRLDPDRYLTALFAPSGRRESLMALYAFNAEVARIREAVSEPMMGRIRLQWWRDSVAGVYAGTPRRHAVVEPLAEAVQRHALPQAPFEALLEAREQDMSADPPETLEALQAYAEATSGGLAELALGVVQPAGAAPGDALKQAARDIGTAWALTGLLRAVPFHAHRRRVYLPTALMNKHGARRRDLMELRPSPELARVAEEVARCAQALLAQPLVVARRQIAPFLLAPLAKLYLRRLQLARYDVFDPRIAAAPPGRLWRLLLPAVLGRV
jgi:phytoene synthase